MMSRWKANKLRLEVQFAARPGTKNKLEIENAYLLELAIRILERADIGAYEIAS